MSRKQAPAGLLERLPSLLTYPLRGSLLWMLAALCVLRLLNNLPNLLGVLCEVMFLVMAFKLAVEALTNTAHGRDEPLAVGELAATDGEAMRQLGLQVLLGIVLAIVAELAGLTGFVVAMLATIVLMPAAVILLTMTGSLLAALNPLSWFALIGRLGVAYFAAVALTLVLAGLSTVAEFVMQRALPYGIGGLPATFIGLYSLVVIYHVLGDLIHRHADELELDTSPAVARAAYANPLEDDTMAAAGNAAADGRPGDGATLLQELFRGRGASDPVHERYRELVIAAGDIPRLSQHDREYVPSLFATGKDKRALAVYLDASARDGEFRIDHDETVARLVAQAARSGQSRLAVQLAQGFEERFPKSDHTAPVVHAVAWTMADQFDQGQAALGRLQRALRANPQHPLTEQMEALVLQIGKLPGVAAAPLSR